MENNDVNDHDLDGQEDTTPDVDNDEQGNDESIEEYKARLAKAETLAHNYKIRAEKAEKAAKEAQPKGNATAQPVTPAIDDQTLARIYGIHEDDFQEVKDMAAFKNISIADALKLGATKAILAERAEFRKTAEVSNTGNARRGATKVSDTTVLADLAKGKIPAAGTEEAEQLFWARRGGKRQ